MPQDDPILQELVEWHCAPHLPVARGSVARAAGAASMTDNSDGLIRDLGLIADRSAVCIDIESAAIAPDEKLQHAAECVGGDAWKWVLTGGEDHTLLGTTDTRVPSGFKAIGRVRSLTSQVAVDVFGEHTDESAVLVDGTRPSSLRGGSPCDNFSDAPHPSGLGTSWARGRFRHSFPNHPS